MSNVSGHRNSGLVRPAVSNRTKIIVLLLGIAALCTEVEASNAIATMAVSAIVRNACTATSSTTADGAQAVARLSATGEVAVDCAMATPYSVAMNTGVISGEVIAKGYTASAANTQAHMIYEDQSLTKTWGSVDGPDTLSGTYRSLQAPLPVYGTLTNSQAEITPNSDRVTMSVNY